MAGKADSIKLKLKLKLTAFSIAHHTKGDPFSGALNSKHSVTTDREEEKKKRLLLTVLEDDVS